MSEKVYTSIAEVEQRSSCVADWAEATSLIVNILLFIIKAIAVYISESMSIWASLADSGVDLVSQGVLYWASYKGQQAETVLRTYEADNKISNDANPEGVLDYPLDYPLGRLKSEPLGVLACAAIMIMSTVEVLQFSSLDLIDGLVHHIHPEIDVNAVVYGIMGSCIGVKLLMWAYCKWAAKLTAKSGTLEALAEDHLNDVMSNVGAIIGAAVGFNCKATGWWVDSAGAVMISAIILYRWSVIILECVRQIDGYKAPKELIDKVKDNALDEIKKIPRPLEAEGAPAHVKAIRSYFNGTEYYTELELSPSPEWDLSLQEFFQMMTRLRSRIEKQEDVSRVLVLVSEANKVTASVVDKESLHLWSHCS